MSEQTASETQTERAHAGNSPSPRLTQLELHGYKTFADKTRFVFTGGITAIVGPNGSGKSNVADAIRWVLGEQSYSLLRGKRTEDMIFSGSELRARMGMATVSVTFDNTSGWLPVDFATVVLTRRAYRSGENEYFLNGTRVRLRDIQDLLATSGLAKRSYTVIGQGLVDQALSLRPEERRNLIEEAAGITAYKRKRDQALTRLAEVEANLLRVQDIVAEITPRLKRLERQAERARQYQLMEEELKSLLLTWYGYRWHQGLLTLEAAKAAQQAQEEKLAQQRARVQALEQELEALRQEQVQLKEVLQEKHAHIAALHRQVETLVREEAVLQERIRGLEAQRESILSELPSLESYVDILRARLQDALKRQQALEAERTALHEELEQARQALAESEAKRSQAAAAVQAARERILTLTSRIAQLQEQAEQLNRRIRVLEQKVAQQEKQVDDLRRQQAVLHEQLEAKRKEVLQLRTAEEGLQERIVAAEQDIAAQQEAVERARDALQRAQGGLRSLEERYDLLSKLREEGSGLYSGVRAVLNSKQLRGVVGVVAELLQVPREYETAIEVALGSSLQDVVVERWQDAEAAIQLLKAKRAGRATFLPLDTIRPPQRGKSPKMDGVIGIAADVVAAEARLRPVVELLLNRTLLVEDLKVARRVLPQARGLRIVTLAGELVRGSGRVTGGEGKQQRAGMLLAREREWRELPTRIERARAQVEALRQALSEQEDVLTKLRGERRTLLKASDAMQQQIAQAVQQEHRLEQEWTRSNGMLQAGTALLQRMQEELAGVRAQLARVHQQTQKLEEELESARKAHEEAQQRLELLDDEGARERLRRLDALWASLEGRQQSVAQTVQSLQEDLQRQTSVIEARRQRLENLAEQEQMLTAQLETLQKRLAEVRERLAALERPVHEAEERLQTIQDAQDNISRRLEEERRRLHQAESHLSSRVLAVQRAEDALNQLRRDIEEDFGLVRLEEESAAFPAQDPLPLENGVVVLPKVTQIPPELEAEVKRLRVRLRNLGGINPNAPEEYEQLHERYLFLQGQMADLREASADLHRALDELEQVMQREFRKTFKAVARHFRYYFERLFGGGSARLVLTTPEDVRATGIDIIVRPPGKRTQGLAMLSGGERALTASALIFAILRVSPPPFVVLDEVDAALDEANVGRFRQTLKELAHDTQFIVITHNRGTIEAADTIYGISMAKDGVSKTLSLDLEEIEKAA